MYRLGARRRRGLRGTILVMVVAVLALLFILGVTLTMVSRFDRRAAEGLKVQLVDPPNSLDTFAVSLVLPRLFDDVHQDLGLDAAAEEEIDPPAKAYSYPYYNATTGQGPFPQDTAQYTDGVSNLSCASLEPYPHDVDSIDATNYYDAEWRWPAVTLIDRTGEKAHVLYNRRPHRVPFYEDASGRYRYDKNYVIYPDVTADADGDGVLDAVWEDAGVNETPPDTGTGIQDLRVAVRILPTTAFANLRYSHPAVVARALGNGAFYESGTALGDRTSVEDYDLADEVALRRRNGLPERGIYTAQQIAFGGYHDRECAIEGDFPCPLLEHYLRQWSGQYLYYLADWPIQWDPIRDAANPSNPDHELDEQYWARQWWLNHFADARLKDKTPGFGDRDWGYRYSEANGYVTTQPYGGCARHLLTVRSSDHAIRRDILENQFRTKHGTTGLIFRMPDYGEPLACNDLAHREVEGYGNLWNNAPSMGPFQFSLANAARLVNPRYDDDVSAPRQILPYLATTWGLLLEGASGDTGYELELDSPAHMHGDFPGSQGLSLQAAMLAVNTKDFADSTGSGLGEHTVWKYRATSETVVGFEKQPFITEVYAHLVKEDVPDEDPDSLKWESSLFAVELHWPYQAPDADFYTSTGPRYSLRVVPKQGDPGTFLSLGAIAIPGDDYAVFYYTEGFPAPWPTGGQVPSHKGKLGSPFDDMPSDITVELIRSGETTEDGLGHYHCVVDRMVCGSGGSGDERTWKVSRDTSPWRFAVAAHLSGQSASLGGPNTGVSIPGFGPYICPLLVADVNHNVCREDAGNANLYGVAYPSASLLLLVPRYAHYCYSGCTSSSPSPAGAGLSAKYPLQVPVTEFMRQYSGVVTGDPSTASVDNGHIPVFDPRFRHEGMGNLDNNPYAPASPPPQVSRVPWGQLLLDFFTSVAYVEQPDPTNPLDPYHNAMPGSSLARSPYPPKGSEQYRNLYSGVGSVPGFLRYGRNVANPWPMPNRGGREIAGRLNIDAAPWTLIAGLPLIDANHPGFAAYDDPTDPDDLYSQLTGNDPVYSNENDQVMPVMRDFRVQRTNDINQSWYGRRSYLTISDRLAQAIVAWRDRRGFTDAQDIPDKRGAVDPGMQDEPNCPIYEGSSDAHRGRDERVMDKVEVRVDPGLTTVLEIANVQPWLNMEHFSVPLVPGYAINDSGAASNNWLDWIKVLARLDDKWVTTRSNTFYTYTTVFGSASRGGSEPHRFYSFLRSDRVAPPFPQPVGGLRTGVGLFYLYTNPQDGELYLAGGFTGRLKELYTPHSLQFREGPPGYNNFEEVEDNPVFEVRVTGTGSGAPTTFFNEPVGPGSVWPDAPAKLLSGECYMELFVTTNVPVLRGQVIPEPNIRRVEMMVDRTNVLDMPFIDANDPDQIVPQPEIIAGPIGQTAYHH